MYDDLFMGSGSSSGTDEDIWDLIDSASDGGSVPQDQYTGGDSIGTDDMMAALGGGSGNVLDGLLGQLAGMGNGAMSWIKENPKLTGELATLLLGTGGAIYGKNQLQALQKQQDPFAQYRPYFAGELANLWKTREQSPGYQLQQQNLGALSNMVNSFWSNPQYTGGKGGGPFY